MRYILATLLTASSLAFVAPAACADQCVTVNEFSLVDMGDTKGHVEQGIFDGYAGVLVDAWTADGWNWKQKAYAECDGSSDTIVYRRDAGSDDPFRVFNTSASASAGS